MNYTAAFTFCALTAAFWGLVFWAADAFGFLEIAAIVGTALLLGSIWFWWEYIHSPLDPGEPDEFYVPDDWLWPPHDDTSKVRHGGLGR